MKLKLISALVAGLLSAAPAFSATLDFQGAGEYNFINDYYNGGTNDAGASGPNFGVSFGPDAFVLDNDAYFTYFSNSPNAGILSVIGENAALNVAAGFTGAVSFWYSSSENTTVTIFSGLNGTGSALATFNLLANAQNGCSDTLYCHWDFASLSLDGVAKSIQFGSAANIAGFDNISVAPVPLPAAGWAMLSALGGLGAIARRKRAA